MSSTPMKYDERYMPHIQNLRLLPFIQMVSMSISHMNPAAITALVDRWRPETHSFYLRTSEMTSTLEAMAMNMNNSRHTYIWYNNNKVNTFNKYQCQD
jgi:hypothetical protein